MSDNAEVACQETVRVALDLPVSLLQWIEGLKIQMGFSSRSEVIVLLLQELVPSE